jgi:hypothetical protein
VKTASKLFSIAFAAAAIVTASLPAAQPAHAAGGFDLKPELRRAYTYGDSKRVMVVDVRNIGTDQASPFTVMYYCDYMMDNGKVERASAGAYPVLFRVHPNSVAAWVEPGECSKYQGRAAFRMGAFVAAPGDINDGNNRLEKSFI